MFERLRAGWRLAKEVRLSVSKDKSMYMFPIASGLLGVFIFIFTLFMVFFAFSSSVYNSTGIIFILAFFVASIVVMFTTTYFLLAMLIAYRSFNSGNPISFKIALSKTWEYKKYAFEWAIFYTIIVSIIRAIESRIRGIAGMLIGIIGSLTITIATFFAVPAILEEKVGPIKAIESSIHTIRRNFGMTFGGVAYVDLYTLIFILLGFFLIMGSIFIMGSVALPFIFFLLIIALGAILVVFGLILKFTYMNVLKFILYDYFNGKGLPEGFDETTINTAMKRKRGKMGMDLGDLN
ncbi:MAG: DUF6159 family protein [Candidatus Thermoplasmatota archaeon]|nr:DUF6159 family protein [Candidatus Thermoplasmatota archaeon]